MRLKLKRKRIGRFADTTLYCECIRCHSGVHVSQLHSRSIQAVDYDPDEPLVHFVSEDRIGVTFLPDARSVESDGADILNRSHIVLPLIGWLKPRPADDVPGRNGLDDDGAIGRIDLKSGMAVPYQVKVRRRFPAQRDELAFPEVNVAGAACDEVDVVSRDSAKEFLIDKQVADGPQIHLHIATRLFLSVV
jgi:hypothetical protein